MTISVGGARGKAPVGATEDVGTRADAAEVAVETPALQQSPGASGASAFRPGTSAGAPPPGGPEMPVPQRDPFGAQVLNSPARILRRVGGSLRALAEKVLAHVNGELGMLKSRRHHLEWKINDRQGSLRYPPMTRGQWLANLTHPKHFYGKGPDLPSLVMVRYIGISGPADLGADAIRDALKYSPVSKLPELQARLEQLDQAIATLRAAEKSITAQEQADAASTFAWKIMAAEAKASSAARGYDRSRSRYDKGNVDVAYRQHQAELEKQALSKAAQAVAAAPTVTPEARQQAIAAAMPQVEAALASVGAFLAAHQGDIAFPDGTIPDDGLAAWQASQQGEIDQLRAELDGLDREIARLEL
jgi:hypothetical protein